MTLRIMLLGLVASMGIELPSGADLSSWTRSGREWAAASGFDLSRSCVAEADRPDECPTGCHQAGIATGSPVAVEDSAFEAAMAQTAAEFSADLIAMEFEGSAVDAMIAAGPSQDEGPMCLAASGDEADTVAVGPPGDEPAEAIEEPTRLDRVASAVRLTREAVQAWAAVLEVEETADEAGPAR